MTARASFTQAEIARAIKAARAVNPDAVVEIVTGGMTLRILPGESAPIGALKRQENTCDNAFGAKG